MTTFHPSDRIFATIRQRGRVIDSLQMSGVSSFSEIVSRLRGLASGLVTIDLRNGSRGWMERRQFMMVG